MSNEMKWSDYLEWARTEAKDAIKYDHDADPHDVARDVADTCAPIYNYDILKLAADNVCDLALAEPEVGLAFDGSATPVNIIAANIYEALCSEAYQAAEEALEELEGTD